MRYLRCFFCSLPLILIFDSRSVIAAPSLSTVPAGAKTAITAAYTEQDHAICQRDINSALSVYQPNWTASVTSATNDVFDLSIAKNLRWGIDDRRKLLGGFCSGDGHVSINTTILSMNRHGETISVHVAQKLKTVGGHPAGPFMGPVEQEDRIDDWGKTASGWKLMKSRNVVQMITNPKRIEDQNAERRWEAQESLETLSATFDVIREMKLSPNARYIALQTYSRSFWEGRHWSTEIWDLQSKTKVADLTDDDLVINSVSFSPDGASLAMGEGQEGVAEHPQGAIAVFDTQAWKQKARWKVSGASIATVAYAPDGRRLASICGNGQIIVWDATSGERTHTLGTSDGLDLTGGGEYLALTANGDIASGRGGLFVWNLTSGKQILTQEQLVTSAAWSPDGKTLAVGGDVVGLPAFGHCEGGQVYFYSLSNLQHPRIYTWPFPEGSVDVIGWTPSGKNVLLQSRSSIVALNLASGKPNVIIDAMDVQSAAISPDGKSLAFVLNEENKHIYLKKLSVE